MSPTRTPGLATNELYRFRVISDSYTEPGTVWRVIDIPNHRTLSTLNRAICCAYDRWDNQLWSFYFGQPGKRGTQEYVTYKDKRRFGRKTKSGHEAKLKFLPLQQHQLFYYVWSYDQQWWHRIEFLGVQPMNPDVQYPLVVESHGDAPPVHIDFLAPRPAAEITTSAKNGTSGSFDELDAAISRRASALPTPEIVGYLRGAVSAENTVMPSRYFGLLLGSDPFESEDQVTALYALLIGLHNQLADSISSESPLVLRRASYLVSRDGLQLIAADLRLEMQGFRRGLDLGGSDPEHLDADGRRGLLAMAEVDALLEGLASFLKRGTSLKPAEIAQLHKQLQATAETVDTIMLDIGLAFRATRKQRTDKIDHGTSTPNIGRNDPCPCGSGKKYKACCLRQAH
jgi:hypothetical protein